MNKYKDYLKMLLEIAKETEQSKDTLDKIVDNIRVFWWKYVLYTLTTGILALFITSLVLDKSITIADMNSWVGIILGLVASVIGIISMFLSFYNLDQSIKTQDKTLETIENIKNEIIVTVNKNSEKTIDELHKTQYAKSDSMKLNGDRKDWE